MKYIFLILGTYLYAESSTTEITSGFTSGLTSGARRVRLYLADSVMDSIINSSGI